MSYYQQLTYAVAHKTLAYRDTESYAAEFLMAEMPWLNSTQVTKAIQDRTSDSLLRTYLWSYPVGIAAFMHLVEAEDQTLTESLLVDAYRRPIQAPDLLSRVGLL